MAGSVGSSRGPCGCHRSASRSSSSGRAQVARPTTERGITGARKTGRPSRLHEGASEAVICRVADFDVELARMASTAVSSLDDPAKLAEIDACYDSTFHMREEHVHMANMSGAGP